MPNAAEWKAWNEERERFRNLMTEGYQSDIKRLEDHIHTLIQVAPKDQAGWMNGDALDVLNMLQRDLTKTKTFAGLMP